MSITNKNSIFCRFHNDKERAFYIDENLKVLPCCHYASHVINDVANSTASDSIEKLDPVFAQESKLNPLWNDISERSIEEIMQHKIYKHHLFKDGWDSDKPSGICLMHCVKRKTYYKTQT